jgi:tRNA pseudouridine65 synthase
MPPQAAASEPTADATQIVHLDERICAVAKPAGIMVHPTNISTDRVFMSDLLRSRLGRPVHAVHRLDRATSGVLVFALDREAAALLGRQFAEALVDKRYLAVVRGWIDEAGAIDRALKRNRGAAQQARTNYRCLGRAELPVAVAPHHTARYSLVEVAPRTGRRHQIRRHFNGVAHPVIGDVNHGDRRHNRLFRARFGCHRLLLHAAEITFCHPGDGALTTIRSALPAGFAAVMGQLGWRDPTRGNAALSSRFHTD